MNWWRQLFSKFTGGSDQAPEPSSKPQPSEEDSKLLKLRNVGEQSPVTEGADVDDLVSLTHLHEPSMLYTLRERYAQEGIYTFTGKILLAINPFFRIPLYGGHIVDEYRREGAARVLDPDASTSLPPHPYAIADNAYNAMAHPIQPSSSSSSSSGQGAAVSGPNSSNHN